METLTHTEATLTGTTEQEFYLWLGREDKKAWECFYSWGKDVPSRSASSEFGYFLKNFIKGIDY
jgi:hypothetical protein